MNNKKINILIVEDEFITSEVLSEVLLKKGYDIGGIAQSANEALHILQNQRIDLAILDINIQGDKDGVFLANVIQKDYQIPFVFLTAFGDQFTVDRAIASAPFGYLLKPFNDVDVFATVELALKNFDLRKQPNTTKSNLDFGERIFVRDNYGFEAIHLSEILYLQAGKNYIDIYLAEKKHLVRSSLKDMMDLLPESHFVQIHKSYVVNKSHVIRFESTLVQMTNMESLPLGGIYKDDFRQHFNTLL